MSNDKLRELDRLAKHFDIAFDGPGSTERWPDVHARHFKAIQAQGLQTYESYRNASRVTFNDQPWRSWTKQRAEQVAAEARQLHYDKSNEMEWRLSLEPDILARFKHRITCIKCHLRVWRSDVEVVVDPERAQKIEKRRQRRGQARCKCSEYDRMQQGEEEDLDRIFSDRAERFIIPEKSIQSVLLDQKPDRVYGLRQTSQFADVLSDLYYAEDGIPSSESYKERMSSISPFGDKCEPLLFPFLILEAKANESPSFQLIQTQTAFPIRALLQLQHELRSHSTILLPFPLLWFVANKGSEWRVYACFIETSDIMKAWNGQSNKKYRVVKLWAGDICEIDKALQLLLIIDYIFDWARDEYRGDIFRRLCQIARPNIPDNVTVSGESKLYSRYPGSTMPETPEDGTMTENSDQIETPNIRPYREFDTEAGCLRSATCIESRVRGLFINRDNVDTLLQSVRDEQRFARGILSVLPNNKTSNMKLTARDLSNIHEIWTGDAGNSTIAGQFETFHTKLAFRSFFTKTWDLVRELSYLAVSDDAIKVLFARSRRMREVTLKSISPATDSLATELHRLRTGCAEFNVHAAMVRLSLAFVMEPEVVTRSKGRKKTLSSPYLAVVNTREEAEKCGRIDESYAVIHKIYSKHTIDRTRLVAESYFRKSSREEQQSNYDANADSHPIALPNTLHVHKESQGDREFVLMIGKLDDFGGAKSQPDLCLYQIKGKENVTIPQLTSLVYKLAERRAKMNMTCRCGPEKLPKSEIWNAHTCEVQMQAMLPWGTRRSNLSMWIKDLFGLLPKALKADTMSIYDCYINDPIESNDTSEEEEWGCHKGQPIIPRRDAVLASLTLASRKGFQVPIDITVIESWTISGCLRYRAPNDRSKRRSKHLYIDERKLSRWFDEVWHLKADILKSAATRAEQPVQFVYPNTELVNKIVAEQAASSSNQDLPVYTETPKDHPAPKRKRSTERARTRKR